MFKGINKNTLLLLLIGFQSLSVVAGYKDIKADLFANFKAADNSDSAFYYANRYLQNAKIEGEDMDIYTGYALIASLYENKNCLLYADSLIALTENNSTMYYPAMAYFHKAHYYTKNLAFDKVIDNIVLAKKYAEMHDNELIIAEANTLLGMAKINIGDYYSALDAFHQNLKRSVLDTIGGNYPRYLDDVFNIASAYNEIKNIDSADYYNQLGLTISLENNFEVDINYFKFNNAITDYLKTDYTQAKVGFNETLPFFLQNNDQLNILETYYFLGHINRIQGNDGAAKDYFEKIDSNYNITNKFYPKYRDIYQELRKIANKNDETELELTYIDKLLTIDSMIINDNAYVKNKILTEFEISDLLKDKELLIEILSAKNKKAQNYLMWLSPILIIVLLILAYQFVLRRNDKKKAELLLKEINERKKETKPPPLKVKTPSKPLEISDKILNDILLNLEKFEQKAGYLNANLTISILAKKVGSNTKYVSKVINEHKGSSFSEYINTLRINKAIERLKTEQKFKNYTIKAIAKDSGFNQAESFAAAFYKSTNVKPSHFIKALKKESELPENSEA